MYIGYGSHLVIDQSVVNTWDEHRQADSQALESFGVLIGSCQKISDICNVETVTTPSKDDFQSRSRFLLKDRGHQIAVDRAFHRSRGHLGYLGTWHTHPEADPSPSMIDIEDWLSCTSRNPDRPLYFVIVGTEKTHVFVKFRNKFRKLKSQGSIKP